LDPAQTFAQQVLDTRVSKGVVLAELGEHRQDLSLSKAQATQRREELGLGVERLGSQHLAVFGAIPMPEVNAHDYESALTSTVLKPFSEFLSGCLS
jgi:hypothetical protein